MKKYFKSKVVVTADTTLQFIPPKADPMTPLATPTHYLLHRDGDEEVHVVDCADDAQVSAVLAAQHPECQVELQDFSFIENALKESRFYRAIDEEVVTAIRAKYSIDDELRIMKLTKTSAEYVAMVDHINACRLAGDAKKTTLGLKQ